MESEKGSERTSTPKPSELVDQLLELQDKYDRLKNDKEKAEKDFCIQRAKLKELFLSREGELKEERGTCRTMKEEAMRLKAELESFRKAAELSETEREQEVRTLRKNYQEEAVSMQRILEEAVEEAKKISAEKYETERQTLLQANQELESRINELQSGQAGVDGILTSITHILKKPSSPGVTSSNEPKKETTSRTLEDSMVKAQEDAEVLRSIVMPLEQEICSLKAKLKDSQEKVKLLETQNREASAAEAEKYQVTTEDQTKALSTEELRDKVKELQHYLESERSSRTDLEMYVAVLNTQKGVLQEDADKLRKELHNVCRLLEQEKQAHRELKETWQQVYEQFLDAQDAQTAELEQIKTLLTSEQIEQLKEEGVSESLKNTKTELPRPSSAEPTVGQLIPISPFDTPKSSAEASTEKSLLDSSNPSLDTLSLGSIMSVPCTNSPQVSYNISQDLADVVLPSGKAPVRRVQSLSEITDSDKGLSDDGRTQSDNDLTSSIKSEADIDMTDSVVRSKVSSPHSQIDWKFFQDEITFSSQEQLSTQSCAMCTNYEQQLQKVQKEKQAIQELAAKLQMSVDRDNKLKILLAEEKEVRSNLEQGIAQATEDAQAQINSHVNTQLSLEKLLSGLQENFEAAKQEAQEQLSKLQDSRDQAHRELRLLQDEYSKLQEHALKRMTDDESHQDSRMAEMREQMQQVQAAQDNTEEKLRSEILFLKDRVIAEQFAKENMEETLQLEIESTKEELAVARAELENEKKGKSEIYDNDANQAVKSVQAKSREVILALQNQLEEADQEKTRMESEYQQLKNQLQSLQEQLNNSETVQRDFVRLSQSLQMQIAQIQESQSEVRWQHEDDSNMCKKCQKQLVMARDKHHCRHCGKIFCDSCTSNTVDSHVAKKPLKVCNECFAMLRKDANTSYFNVHLADEKT